jgi:hypothetical protein
MKDAFWKEGQGVEKVKSEKAKGKIKKKKSSSFFTFYFYFFLVLPPGLLPANR